MSWTGVGRFELVVWFVDFWMEGEMQDDELAGALGVEGVEGGKVVC